MRASNYFIIGGLLLVVAVPIVLANLSEIRQGEATNQAIRDCIASPYCDPAPGEDPAAVLANNERVMARDRFFIGAGVALGAAGVVALVAGGVAAARAPTGEPHVAPPTASAEYRRHECGALIGASDKICTICGRQARNAYDPDLPVEYSCSTCGARVGGSDGFCFACGNKLGVPVPVDGPDRPGAADELVHALKLRLARGEISLDEYEKLRAALAA